MTHRCDARATLCAVVAGLTLLACSDDGAERNAPPDLDFTEFDLAIESFVTAKGLNGAGSIVVHKDWGIVHEQVYGSHAAGRISLIASSSKVLSAAVLVRLADQGLLNLDAPISTYLGAWGAHKTDVTVAQLLSNSSGLVGLADNPLYAPYLCQYVPSGTLVDCAKSVYTADDAADRAPPDTRFRYGGGPWQLAGGIAEVVSGKTWDELVAETYGPCGADTLGYTNHYAQAFGSGGLGAALSYPTFFSGDLSTLTDTDNPNIEGGAFTTVLEYGKILLMHLREGSCGAARVLSEGGVERMQQDRIAVYGETPNARLKGYGLGWWVSRDAPGYVVDAGAYGAFPWIDGAREYAAFVVIEASSTLGAELHAITKPIADTIFDGER
jgi:CubicO group peptidase (beta-lactamase class C family)